MTNSLSTIPINRLNSNELNEKINTSVEEKANIDLSNTSFANLENVDGTLTWDGKPIAVGDTTPVGSIFPYGGSSAPSGYLLCNGAAVSRTTYADLFAAISTTYGVGNGSTTFNLPNLSSARMVTSSTVSVKGNGKTFNLTDGTNTVSIKSSSYNLQIGAYTANINTGISGGTINNGNSLGVSKDTSKSGITGTASLATATRFIIKY